MTLKFILFAEDQLSAHAAAELADRVFLETEVRRQASWIEASHLPNLRTWSGILETTAFGPSEAPHGSYTPVKKIKRLYLEHRKALRLPRMLKKPQPGASQEYVQARRAWILARRLADRDAELAAVVFVRDIDQEAQRIRDVEQTLNDVDERLPLALALPQPEVEAWVLNGYEPQDDGERQALETQCGLAGFDVCAQAERFPKSKPGATLDIKNVVAELTADEYERQRQCWQDTSLDTLRERGQQTGLTAYLGAVEAKLLPLVTS